MTTIKHNSGNKRIGAWFMVSVAVHAMVLALFSIHSDAILPVPKGSTRIAVVLVAPTQKKPVARKVRKVLQAPSPARIAKPVPRSDQKATAVATQERRLQQNYLLGKLRSSLSRHLVYPPLARKQGWQGVVTVGLRVETDGMLQKIRLRKSSGYHLLDSSAIASLRKIRKLDTEERYSNQSHNLTLRVVYQLTGNGYGTSAF